MVLPAARLNKVFQALSDPTRRRVLERLTHGEVPMSELAHGFDMALPSFSQHLTMLEDCGLVKSKKTGRVRTYRLAPRGLQVAEGWIDRQRDPSRISPTAPRRAMSASYSDSSR